MKTCKTCKKDFSKNPSITYKQWAKQEFCSGSCWAKSRTGKSNSRYKGRYITNCGYVAVVVPSHPYRTVRNTVLEHRLVMEKVVGRYLNPDEVVHHRNGVRTDNRIENLEITTPSEHIRNHRIGYRHSPETRKRMSESAFRRYSVALN